MVADFRGGGPNVWWGPSFQIGDVDGRYLCKMGRSLLWLEFKNSYEEMMEAKNQRLNYQDVLEIFHPHIWVVYIIGTLHGPRNEVQCEEVYRLMPDGNLNKMEILFRPCPGNIDIYVRHFLNTCGKEVARHEKQRAANDNVRIVPDYGKRKRA
jgi:hypothetical protein